MEGRGHIRTIRIDVPLLSTSAYLFVDADQSRWDPWWGVLYEYLLSLAPSRPDWQYEPVQNVHVARPPLTDDQRREVVRFLRSAPARQIEEHRTLRRAVELIPEQERRVELVFFSEKPERAKTP
jgi:hypothetical protein